MLDSVEAINNLVEIINNAHYKHYEKSPTGLIDLGMNSSPNGNLIYHLYNNGEITFQKGAWAYLQRGEFTLLPKLTNIENNNYFTHFKFVKTFADQVNLSYVILTEDECKHFREMMEKMISLHN